MITQTDTAKLILPPAKPYTRLGSWSLYERRFQPIFRDDETVLWEVGEVPKGVNPRHWWTVVDVGHLILVAGFHFVNRFGYVQCRHPWGGEWSDHPEYRYD